MKKSHKILKRNLFYSVTGVIALIFGIMLVVIGVALGGFCLWADEKSVDETLLPQGKNLPVFFDVNGNQIDYQTDDYLSPDEVPENLKKAFVALEDKRFYSHDGIDTYRIFGAIVKNAKSGRIVEGASTITQQLVKNTHLTAEKSINRKLNEMAIAMKIEEAYSKNEILSMYTSIIYFGSGAYGVKDASKLYFDCEPSDLTLSQCATLAGIVKNPKKYSPLNNLESATKRRNLVLSVMLDENCITESEYEIAISEKIVVKKGENKNHSFYVDRVIDELTQKLGLTKYQLDNSGYKIYTNMDSKLQSALECESENMGNFARENTNNETIVIDNQNGKILAHFSSTGYPVRRQAGSTLKPFVVYAPALQENVIDLATPILDELTTFGDWTPRNFNDVYFGMTNPRESIKKSINTVAVKIGSYVGETTMQDYGNRFGLTLTADDCNLTLALGATKNGTTTRQIAAAYSALPDGNLDVSSYINYVTLNGKKVYSNAVNSTKVIDSDVAFLLTDCLQDTVKDGTAKTLSTLPYHVAAKTGTTDSDAWCSAYTTAHTICVWHDGNEVGGGHPTIHAKRIFEKIYDGYSPQNFRKPDNVDEKYVDVYSTLKNKSVTFASDCTPSKFTRKEFFRKTTQKNTNQSLFEKANVDFEISVVGNKVKITFVREKVYDYTLIREDVFGEKTILNLTQDLTAYTANGKEIESDTPTYQDGIFSDSKIITIYDQPLSVENPVKYTLAATIKNKNSQNIVLGKSEKSVLIGFTF